VSERTSADLAQRSRGAVRELARSVGWLALVLASAWGAMGALDGVPAWVNGESRDVRVVADLQEAERRVRARLVLPGYFPDTIAWPPERIRVLPGSPPAVALTLADRASGAPHLVLAQTIGPGPIPERLLPAAAALDESPASIARADAGGRGALRRIVGPDGAIWRELSWVQGGRTVVLRSSGSLEELLRMARSARVQP
jgi:hypothetical protein